MRGGGVATLAHMDMSAGPPPPDPEKLLAAWTEWETGENTPGRVMANLKTAGMPELLRALVEQKQAGAS